MGNQDKHQKNMKFLATAAASLALVAADKNAIDAQLMAQVANSSLRAFSGNIAVAVKRLDEYGCWCYFYDNVGRGKGTSVARSLAAADIQTDFHSRPLTETELAAAEGPTTPISLTVVLMVRSRLTARFEKKKTISNCKISCTVTILNQQHR